MANPDRLLGEISDAIASGNKVFTAFLIGSVVWWSANLLPYDFSELGVTTPTAKLTALKKASKDANSKCGQLMHNYATALATAPQSAGSAACHLAPPALPGAFGLAGPGRTREDIYEGLIAAFRAAGPAISIERIQESLDATAKANSCGDIQRLTALAGALSACRDSRAELTKFNEHIDKQS